MTAPREKTCACGAFPYTPGSLRLEPTPDTDTRTAGVHDSHSYSERLGGAWHWVKGGIPRALKGHDWRVRRGAR